ncbi:MAG: hypothetical protein HY080_09665 [Gammaproteobacteria bacterium]|nr:hypothetical protein [Gammaproteobacteria bacterium]
MLTFQKLWDNHPTITGNDNPCTTNGKVNFSDQCAIRLGVALAACGVNTAHLPGVRHCWQHKKSEGHVLVAEELAHGLKRFPVGGLGSLQHIKPAEFKEVLASQKGIILFKDYWRRTVNGKKEEYRNRSGDHIDLWNGQRLTSWFSWVRIQANFSWEGSFTNFRQAKEIWFWRIF